MISAIYFACETVLKLVTSVCTPCMHAARLVRSSVSPNLPENYRYFAAKFCFGLVDNLLGNAGTEPIFCSNLLLL